MFLRVLINLQKFYVVYYDAGTCYITRQHGCDGKDFIGTVMFAAGDHHLSKLWIQRELRHHGSEGCEVTIVVKSSQVVQQFKSSHQGFGC